jgi:hypothetical protein
MPATALPVREPAVAVEMLAPMTVTDAVLAPTGDDPVDALAPILGSSRVLVRGPRARLADRAVVGRDEVAVAATRADGVVLDLAAAPGLVPGPVPVQLLAGSLSRSNVLTVPVRPTLTPTRSGSTLACAVTPHVGRDQRAVALLDQRDAPAGQQPHSYVLPARPGNGASGAATTSSSVPFDLDDVQPGTYLVRLEVDGVASVLGTDLAGRYSTPVVTVP